MTRWHGQGLPRGLCAAIVLAAVLLGLAFGPHGAHASTLPPASTYILLEDDSVRTESQSTSSISAMISQDFTTGIEGNGFIRTTSTASASLGSPLVPPAAVASGSAETMLDPEDPPGSGVRQRALSSASATATYYAQLAQIQTIPSTYQISTVPLTASMFANASVSQAGQAFSTSSIRVVDGGTLAFVQAVANVSAGIFSDSMAISPTLRVNPSSVLELVVSAGGSTVPINNGSGSFVAAADPYLRFDQDEFDRITDSQGLPPLMLSDYYAIEYSVGVGVPEPSGAACLAGLLFAVGARRRAAWLDA